MPAVSVHGPGCGQPQRCPSIGAQGSDLDTHWRALSLTCLRSLCRDPATTSSLPLALASVLCLAPFFPFLCSPSAVPPLSLPLVPSYRAWDESSARGHPHIGTALKCESATAQRHSAGWGLRDTDEHRHWILVSACVFRAFKSGLCFAVGRNFQGEAFWLICPASDARPTTLWPEIIARPP